MEAAVIDVCFISCLGHLLQVFVRNCCHKCNEDNRETTDTKCIARQLANIAAPELFNVREETVQIGTVGARTLKLQHMLASQKS